MHCCWTVRFCILLSFTNIIPSAFSELLQTLPHGILNGHMYSTEFTKVKEAFFVLIRNKIITLQFQIFRNHGTEMHINIKLFVHLFIHSAKHHWALLCSKPVTSCRDTVVNKLEAHGDFCLKNTNISELSGEGEARDKAQDYIKGLQGQVI